MINQFHFLQIQQQKIILFAHTKNIQLKSIFKHNFNFKFLFDYKYLFLERQPSIVEKAY